jgi:hypothetical protein
MCNETYVEAPTDQSVGYFSLTFSRKSLVQVLTHLVCVDWELRHIPPPVKYLNRFFISLLLGSFGLYSIVYKIEIMSKLTSTKTTCSLIIALFLLKVRRTVGKSKKKSIIFSVAPRDMVNYVLF